MDIGTAKATPAEQALVPHHLLDVVDPDEDFSVADFLPRARRASPPSTAAGACRWWSAAPASISGPSPRAWSTSPARTLPCGSGWPPRSAPAVRGPCTGACGGRSGRGGEHPAAEPGAGHPRPGNLGADRDAALRPPGRPWFCRTPLPLPQLGLLPPRENWSGGSPTGSTRCSPAGLVAEVAGLLEAGFSPNLKALQTIGYREVLDPPAGRLRRRGDARADHCQYPALRQTPAHLVSQRQFNNLG